MRRYLHHARNFRRWVDGVCERAGCSIAHPPATSYTPPHLEPQLEEELRAYVANHSRDFHPQLSLFIDEIQTPRDAEFQGMLRIRLCVHYRGNFHDGEARIRRRTGFLLAVKEAVLKLGIYAKVEVGAGSSTSVPSPPMLVSEAP